jgi:uncharacterized membrane protein YkvA (DUF1232 family)
VTSASGTYAYPMVTSWLLYGLAVTVVVYALIVAVLAIAGRGDTARMVARFVPDCVILFGRLLRDPRVPRRRKLLLAALIPYLAMPFDLVPDFIPVAGQLDDAIVVAFVLRRVARGDPGRDPRWTSCCDSSERRASESGS